MKERRPKPSRMLEPLRNPNQAAKERFGWVQGYAGTPRRDASAHALRAHLVHIRAPVVLAMPAPTVAYLSASDQRISDQWTSAGTLEVHGVRGVNFYVNNTGAINPMQARPFRIIQGVRFVDDGEAPYIIPIGEGRRIPVVCDCEVVGLEVRSIVGGEFTQYTVGVGMTP